MMLPFLVSGWLLWLEHLMFWLPLTAPILQVILPPLAFFFFFWPNTKWTNPNELPTDYPDSLYSWVVGKILYTASHIVPTMSFFGHPLNFFFWDEAYKFLGDRYTTMTSFDAAWMMLLFWMVLPYFIPFAWTNNFYLWPILIPLEIAMAYDAPLFQFQIHLDAECHPSESPAEC